MAAINSFSQNLTDLTNSVQDAMALLTGYTEGSVSSDSSVAVTLSNGEQIKIPTYGNLERRMQRVEDTVATFVKGNGVIETDDNTYRNIKVTTLPKSPKPIESLGEISTFDINPNWMFEDFMFPRCIVKVDLTGKIEDDADRIYSNRVILAYNNVEIRTFFNENIRGKEISYPALIELLEKNSIPFSEDEQEVKLPLTYEKYVGDFEITKIALDDDNRLWYYLDTLNYRHVDKNGQTVSSSYELSKGDYIRYNDTLFKIKEIEKNTKKILIDYNVGFEAPSVGTVFSIYNTPFAEKIANIGIGYNEINILYIKGINEHYNILSREWSAPTIFVSNELTLEDTGMTLAEYYPKYVIDFGKEFIAKAKESKISAYEGTVPNKPVIDVNSLNVVQINTQLEATLNTDEYNNLVTSIVSTKSSVEDLRKNIITNKEALIKETDESKRTTLQNTINNDTNSLATATTQYNTLVEELNTLLNENGAIGYTPKYHVRGFFPIPAPVYMDSDTMTGKQEVIGFEIMYRYIHTDETGVDLETFAFTENDATVNGVFSDWNLVTSKFKEQVYDNDLGVYVWKDEEVGDGTLIKINQIDIPIRSGEKVEIKVRSISEAGYPSNPLKSAWSESVIVAFPPNLTNNDAVTNIINSAKDDKTAVVLQETLSSAGLYTHLSDSTQHYKHKADYILYEYLNRKDDGTVDRVSTSVAEYLTTLRESLDRRLSKIENDYNSKLTVLAERMDVKFGAMLGKINECVNLTNTIFQTVTGLNGTISPLVDNIPLYGTYGVVNTTGKSSGNYSNTTGNSSGNYSNNSGYSNSSNAPGGTYNNKDSKSS